MSDEIKALVERLNEGVELIGENEDDSIELYDVHEASGVMREAAAALTAQAEEIERLRAALKPFADCCEYISDDEDNDEWAKFRLIIKNYRDARAALKAAQEVGRG